MPVNVKREPTTPQPRPSSFVSLLSGWVQQAMESFFATQRILIDVAMRQNANAMKALRDSLSDPENSPTTLITELAVEGTANFIEAQRILLDLAQEENKLVMNGVKERVGASNAATAMVNLMRRSIDNFVEMQQEFLTIASKQSQAWLHDMKSGKVYNGSRMVEMAREGMENFVNTQKKLLDVIAEETTNATTPKAPLKAVKKTEIVMLARDASNAMINAQKKLLDVATQQMKVNLQMANRAGKMNVPFRIPVAKLTGEGVRNFVDAEKALIDSMMKRTEPRRMPKPTAKKRTRRTPRPPMVKAAATA